MNDTIEAPENVDFLETSLAAIAELGKPTESQEIPADDFLKQVVGEIGDQPEVESKQTETAPETKPDVKSDDLDEDGLPINPPGKASSQARKGWDALRAVAKEAKAEAARIASEKDAEIENLKAKIANLPDLEAKAKFADEAERELAISRIEATKAYKEVISQPLEAIGTALQEFAQRNELDLEALEDAVAEPSAAKQKSKLEALIAGVGEMDKLDLYQMVRDTQTILAREAKMKAEALEARKEVESREKEAAEKEVKDKRAKFGASIKRTLDTLKDRIPFEPLAEGESLDMILSNIEQKATASNFDTSSVDVQSYSVAAGLLLPRLIQQHRSLEVSLKSAQARIKELTSAAPSTPATKPSAPVVQSGDDFLASVTQEIFRTK